MNAPAQTPHWADRAVQVQAPIVANDPIARDTYRLRVAAPQIARSILPGQFVMLRLPGVDDPLLGRPLALYDTVLSTQGDPEGLEIVYLVIGKLTSRLARMECGCSVELWGPLGNGFLPRPTTHLVMVAGGIGQTPFLALAREYLGERSYGDPPRAVPPAKRVTLCYGVRSKDYLAGIADFERLGVEVVISTDDGSAGRRGLVTELLEELDLGADPASARIVCCGPEPMMHAVAHFAAARKIDCQVSLETPMACGIGICFSCVTRVRDESGQWDYRRTCVEGPVFDAARIEW